MPVIALRPTAGGFYRGLNDDTLVEGMDFMEEPLTILIVDE